MECSVKLVSKDGFDSFFSMWDLIPNVEQNPYIKGKKVACFKLGFYPYVVNKELVSFLKKEFLSKESFPVLLFTKADMNIIKYLQTIRRRVSNKDIKSDKKLNEIVSFVIPDGLYLSFWSLKYDEVIFESEISAYNILYDLTAEVFFRAVRPYTGYQAYKSSNITNTITLVSVLAFISFTSRTEMNSAPKFSTSLAYYSRLVKGLDISLDLARDLLEASKEFKEPIGLVTALMEMAGIYVPQNEFFLKGKLNFPIFFTYLLGEGLFVRNEITFPILRIALESDIKELPIGNSTYNIGKHLIKYRRKLVTILENKAIEYHIFE